jgi:hypothetical protein
MNSFETAVAEAVTLFDSSSSTGSECRPACRALYGGENHITPRQHYAAVIDWESFRKLQEYRKAVMSD